MHIIAYGYEVYFRLKWNICRLFWCDIVPPKYDNEYLKQQLTSNSIIIFVWMKQNADRKREIQKIYISASEEIIIALF